MNQLRLTAEELGEKYAHLETLSQVIHHFEGEMMEGGYVACQFHINGLSLTENDEQKFANLSVREIEVLEISYQTPENLLTGLLDGWIKKLPEMAKACDSLAEAIKFRGLDGRFKDLVDLIDNAQLLVDSLLTIDSLFSKFETVSGADWKKNEVLTAEAVGQTLAAFQKKDLNLVADILEYDLGHSVQVWFELISELHQEVEETFARATQEPAGNGENR